MRVATLFMLVITFALAAAATVGVCWLVYLLARLAIDSVVRQRENRKHRRRIERTKREAELQAILRDTHTDD